MVRKRRKRIDYEVTVNVPAGKKRTFIKGASSRAVALKTAKSMFPRKKKISLRKV